MLDLSICKSGIHKWTNLWNSEGVMDNGGQKVDWCSICGCTRIYNTFDWRKVGDNTFYEIPEAAKELSRLQKEIDKPTSS